MKSWRCKNLTWRTLGDSLWFTSKKIVEAARESLRQEVLDEVARELMRVHRPVRVWSECEHDVCPYDPVDDVAYVSCTGSSEGWACKECCFNCFEACSHDWKHDLVPKDAACPTMRVVKDMLIGGY